MGKRWILRVLGALWLLDAVLQAQAVMFGSDWWRTDLAGSAMGEPSRVATVILWATGVVAAHAVVWNSVFVAVQAVIGLALLTGRGEKLAIAASIPWAIGVWIVGEGMGMLPTGFALLAFGAPGAVLLYPLIGVLAWPGREFRRAATASWVVLWAGLSLLQVPWVYPARQVFAANFHEMAQVMPLLQGVSPALLSGGLAVLQVAIGLGVVRWRRASLAVGVAVSLFYWVCFQGLGGLFSGAATDPGTGPLIVLLAVTLWPRAAGLELVRDGDVAAIPPLSKELSTLAVA